MWAFTQQNRLGRRLLVYILAVSSVVTLLLTGVQLLREFQIDKGEIEQRLAQIEVSYLSSLAQSLWEVNEAAIQAQLDGIIKLPDMAYAELLGVGKVVAVQSGEKVETARRIARQYHVTYHRGDSDESLGLLTVQASMSGAYQRLWDRGLVILATQGVKTFLLSFSILFIIHWLVTARVHRVLKYFEGLDIESGKPSSVMLPTQLGAPDELNDLMHTMTTMHERLSGSFEALSHSREQFKRIFDDSNEPILVLDESAEHILQCNGAASRLFGYSIVALKQMSVAELYGDASTQLSSFVEKVIATRNGMVGTITCITREGEQRLLEVSASVLEHEGNNTVLAIMRDQTEHIKAQKKIERLAYYDVLTGLPNRSLCYDRISVDVARSKRHGTHGAVLFIDVDNFKTVNDSLGHTVGDQLLQHIASRMQRVLRDEDTLARLGGDEFVVLPNLEDADIDKVRAGADIVAAKIRECVKGSLYLMGLPIHVTTSIGIAIYPDDGDSVDEVLRHADAAMYQAKADGRDTHHVYSSELDDGASVRLEMASALRQALAREEFVLDFQPQINLDAGEIIGAEALVRWERPGHGRVSPADFLPHMHELGLMKSLGDWVLRSSCAHWQKGRMGGDFENDFAIAVNVDAQQFGAPDFVEFVESLLDEYAMPGNQLELEITEQALVRDVDDAVEKIVALHARGVSVAIDDFGTGFSSLSYLHRLPVDTVKIDRSFVNLIGLPDRQAGLVDIIIAMGRALELRVIAEGVETGQQARHLAAQDCQYVQGFLYGKPQSWQALMANLGQPLKLAV